MKKKILFISNPMYCGGIEQALLSIFSIIDYKKCDVYYMPYKKGEFVWNYRIPKEVNVIDAPEYLRWHMMYKGDVLKCIAKNLGQPMFIFYYFMAVLKGLRVDHMDYGRQWFWEHYAIKHKAYDFHFDVAIDFRGEIGCYFLVDKIKAKRKYAWFHGDYENYPKRNIEIDLKYWKSLDNLIVVTDAAKKSIENKILGLNPQNIVVIHNLINKNMIRAMADRRIDSLKKDDVYILQVGRLNKVKGFSLSLDACKKMIDDGYSIEWHIVGDGPEYRRLKRRIRELNIEDYFFLEGQKDNPYPYYRRADYYVHTAYAEGKPITIDEAKAFCLPIVSTRFSTVEDQIEDRISGSLVDFNAEAIAEALEELIDNDALRNSYITHYSITQDTMDDDIEMLNFLLNV